MSIVAGFPRDGFIVLAADQLVCRPHLGRTTNREHRTKIVTDPVRPISLCLSGIHRVGRVGLAASQWVEMFLREFVPQQLTGKAVVDMLEERLLPYVRETLSRNLDLPPQYAHVNVLAAVVGDDGAELWAAELADGIDAQRVKLPGFAYWPERVGHLYPRLGPWQGEGVTTPDRVLEVARAAVRAGIDEDARLGEHDRITGGGVDVALVDASGARRFDAIAFQPARA